MLSGSGESYEFGPFHVDMVERELRRGNQLIPLTAKSFDLLLILIRQAGHTVTRSELFASLWPDAVVEDSNLTQTVSMLRKALTENAEGDASDYIVTVTKRGYKFVGPVNVRAGGTGGELEDESRPEGRLPSRLRFNQNYPAMAVLAGALLLVLAGGAYSRFHRDAKLLTDQDVLVMADFTNTTGDTVFDGALRQALAFELEQSPFLKIMDDEEVNQTLQRMGRPAGQQITNDIAHEVCVREVQKATIGGSIASLGKTYLIALQAINCETGATLAREQAEGEGKEQVLKALAKAATGMRAKLGESLSSIQKPDRPFMEVTTPSLEAFKAYALGNSLMFQSKSREAIPHLQRAVELDPTFAEACELLSQAYTSSGDFPRGNESITKAFALVEHASERERLFISGYYYERMTNEFNKAIDAYEALVRIAPRNPRPHNRLGAIYGTRGEYEKALAESLEAFRLGPRVVGYASGLMGTYMNLDRFDEAKAVAARALAQKLDAPIFHQLLLVMAYIQDDHAAQENEIQWFRGKPEEFPSFNFQAYNAMVHGQRRKAEELYQRATSIGQRLGNPWAQLPDPAWIDAQVGDCEAARKKKLNALLLLCGDESALRLAEEQAAKNPPPNPDLGPLLYRRGVALLLAGKGTEAATEFQKILDHKARNWGTPDSTAYLGLARAEAKAGDTAKAKRAYQDFLSLWKDADSDIPTLMEALKEYAALLEGRTAPH